MKPSNLKGGAQMERQQGYLNADITFYFEPHQSNSCMF